MGRRRALAIDRDKRFSGLLGRTLRRAGLALDVVEGRKAGLELLAARAPAIVFIAVERPKKTGFSLFTDVKNVAKNVPVVLVSATVPMADMLLHQKLRIHADAYLDKRQTGEAELLDALNDLLQLNLDDAELEQMAALASDDPDPRGDGVDKSGAGTSRGATGATGAPVREVLASLGVSHAALEESKPIVEPEADAAFGGNELEHLRDEVECLRRDLEVARRAASSSPFSTDYLKLSDHVNREKKKSGRLARELATREDQAEPLRRGLTEAAHRLLESEARQRQDTERIEQLEATATATDEELTRARAEVQRLKRLVSEETETRRQQEQVHAVSLATLEAEMAGEADAVEKRHRDELNHLRHAYSEEHEQVTQLKQQVALLGRQHGDAQQVIESTQRELAERSRKWEQTRKLAEEKHQAELARLEELRNHETSNLERRHKEELETLRERQAEERRQLQQARIVALEELAEKLRRERTEELAAKDAAWQAKLDTVEKEHAEVIVTLRENHSDEVSELNGAHEEQLGRRIGELEEQLEQTTGERERELTREAHQRLTELEQAEAKRRSDLSAQEQQFLGELDMLKQLHEAQLEEMETKHNREQGRLQRERLEALDAKDEEGSAKIEELEARHEQALAAEREQHRSEMSALEKRLLAKLAEAGTHHREELDRIGQRAGGEFGRLRDRHAEDRDQLQRARESALEEQAEQLNRSHADELETRETEWQTKVDDVRREAEAARAAEREELQSVLDALQSTEKRADPAQSTEDGDVAGGLSDGARRLLRELANELDGCGADGGDDHI